jgi:hypothetical protein
MRTTSFAIPVLLVVLGLLASGYNGRDKPVKSEEPLTADEVEIYRAVLQQNVPPRTDSLNVSVRTYPLDPGSPMSGLSNSDCLRGIELQNLDKASRSFHELTSNVLSGKKMKLVDPARQSKSVRDNDPGNTIRKGKPVKDAVEKAFSGALFSLSEIAFDKNHRHAAVSYSLWCGSLCGHGNTLIFEKIGNEWKKTDRSCGGWIS